MNAKREKDSLKYSIESNQTYLSLLAASFADETSALSAQRDFYVTFFLPLKIELKEILNMKRIKRYLIRISIASLAFIIGVAVYLFAPSEREQLC